ncbi:MAG: hypothetical protein HY791_06980 [Deltaproteobacteria bacterium]|nr:hypothetical protein [Deltaproteobacteria bacterium]
MIDEVIFAVVAVGLALLVKLVTRKDRIKLDEPIVTGDFSTRLPLPPRRLVVIDGIEVSAKFESREVMEGNFSALHSDGLPKNGIIRRDVGRNQRSEIRYYVVRLKAEFRPAPKDVFAEIAVGGHQVDGNELISGCLLDAPVLAALRSTDTLGIRDGGVLLISDVAHGSGRVDEYLESIARSTSRLPKAGEDPAMRLLEIREESPSSARARPVELILRRCLGSPVARNLLERSDLGPEEELVIVKALSPADEAGRLEKVLAAAGPVSSRGAALAIQRGHVEALATAVAEVLARAASVEPLEALAELRRRSPNVPKAIDKALERLAQGSIDVAVGESLAEYLSLPEVPGAEPILISMLSHRSGAVRAAAANALARVGTLDAVSELRRASKDAGPDLLSSIDVALELITERGR